MAKDILPWVLGSVLVISAAAAAAIGLTDSTAPNPAIAPNDAMGNIPSPRSNQAAAAAATPIATVSEPKSASVSPTARVPLPPGQVWECEINGQRVFSDAKCGAHASIRQLRELNVMDSVAVAPSPFYGSYGSGYYPPPPSDETPPDYSSDPYVSQQVIVARERARREHFPRHSNNPHGGSKTARP